MVRCFHCEWEYVTTKSHWPDTYIELFNEGLKHEKPPSSPEPEAEHTWLPFSYEAKREDQILPLAGVLVWVYDQYYSGVTVGWRNGSGWFTPDHGSDCSITHWAPMVMPSPPAGAES